MDVKEAIKELRDSYELKHRDWAYRCLETIEAELEKKEAIIKVMATFIAGLDIDEEICKNINHCTADDLYTNCEECIIDYFSKKCEGK